MVHKYTIVYKVTLILLRQSSNMVEVDWEETSGMETLNL